MTLNRRELLRGIAGYTAAGAAQVPRKTNFIFILIDDMGWMDLGCQGSDFYETPNIDRLAAGGVRFTNAYAACPVCSPTRAAVMTGRYPARLQLTDWIPGRKQWPAAKLLVPQFRQQLPHEEVTIAETLKQAGYATASIGKWHLGGPEFSPETQGFDINIAGTVRGSPKSYFGPFDLPRLQGGTEDDYLTERLTTEAEKFIEANRNRPFFLYLPKFAVHLPLQARKAAIEKYARKAKPTDSELRSVYAAMVESVDEAVGRLVRKLDAVKLRDRTMIFFTSDNGGLRYEGARKHWVTSNAPLRAGKGHLYEGGVRVPLIVAGPGVKAGFVCDSPVSSIDYYPTITRGRQADGVDISPLLAGKSIARRPLYWHYPHYSNQGGVPSAAVRYGDYKLIEFYEDGRLELFNIAEDIGEARNMARKLPRKAAELHAMLKRWRASVKASMPTSNPAHDAEKADQGLTGVERPTDIY